MSPRLTLRSVRARPVVVPLRRPVVSKVVATAFVKVSFGSAVPGVVQAPPQPEAVPLVCCAAGTSKSMKIRCALPSTVIVSSIRPLISASQRIFSIRRSTRPRMVAMSRVM